MQRRAQCKLARNQQQRMTIRRGLGHNTRSQRTARARAVFHDHRLFPGLAHLRPYHAGNRVSRVTGGRTDNTNRFNGKLLLRLCNSRCSNEASEKDPHESASRPNSTIQNWHWPVVRQGKPCRIALGTSHVYRLGMNPYKVAV